MEKIVFKTRYLTYEITDVGINKSFTSPDGKNRLIASPAALIVNNDKSEVPSVKASLSGDILSLRFADGTNCELAVQETQNYITFTLKSVSRDDFLYI